MDPDERWRAAALIGAAAGLVVEPLVGGLLFLGVVALSRARRAPMVLGPAFVTAVVLLIAASLTATTASELAFGIAVAAFVPLIPVWSARARPGDALAVAIGLVLGITAHLTVAPLSTPTLPLTGLSSHPNVLGALGALVAPSVAAMTVRLWRSPWWWGAAGIVAAATVATGSRAAVLALVVGVVVVLAAMPGARRTPRLPLHRTAALALIGIVVAAALVGAWAWVRQPTAADAVGLTGRATLWGIAIEAVAERPVLGHGPQAWSRVAPRIEPSVDAQRFPHSHNGYLEIALTFGLVGLTVVVGLFACLYGALGRGPPTLATAAARGTVVAFAVVNLVDAFAVDGRFLALVVLVAGAAWGTRAGARR